MAIKIREKDIFWLYEMMSRGRLAAYMSVNINTITNDYISITSRTEYSDELNTNFVSLQQFLIESGKDEVT